MLRIHRVLPLAAIAAATCLSTSALSADGVQGGAQPAEQPVPAVTDTAEDDVVYGPILARDPLVRGQIKKLYRDQWQFNRESEARLEEVSQQAMAESDPDVRLVLEREGAELKKEIELRNASFGLDIAILNGQTDRAAEFELAIDQMLHPENYRPAPVDPAVAQERARQLGLE